MYICPCHSLTSSQLTLPPPPPQMVNFNREEAPTEDPQTGGGRHQRQAAFTITALGWDLGTQGPGSDPCLYSWSLWVTFLQSACPRVASFSQIQINLRSDDHLRVFLPHLPSPQYKSSIYSFTFLWPRGVHRASSFSRNLLGFKCNRFSVFPSLEWFRGQWNKMRGYI